MPLWAVWQRVSMALCQHGNWAAWQHSSNNTLLTFKGTWIPVKNRSFGTWLVANRLEKEKAGILLITNVCRALFTRLVGWHASAVSSPLMMSYLPSYPAPWMMSFLFASVITYLSFYKHWCRPFTTRPDFPLLKEQSTSLSNWCNYCNRIKLYRIFCLLFFLPNPMYKTLFMLLS